MEIHWKLRKCQWKTVGGEEGLPWEAILVERRQPHPLRNMLGRPVAPISEPVRGDLVWMVVAVLVRT